MSEAIGTASHTWHTMTQRSGQQQTWHSGLGCVSLLLLPASVPKGDMAGSPVALSKSQAPGKCGIFVKVGKARPFQSTRSEGPGNAERSGWGEMPRAVA